MSATLRLTGALAPNAPLSLLLAGVLHLRNRRRAHHDPRWRLSGSEPTLEVGSVKVTISLSTGGDEDGDTAEVSFDEDCGHHPDMLSDLLRRGADTALRLYRDLHPAEKETA